jgi:hypothetical protein
MGGCIGFTIRLPNGRQHRQCRWTNVMPYYINNLKLIREDAAHLKQIVSSGKELIKDYKLPARKRKLPMSGVYGPLMGKLVPLEYGLIVVDCVNHVILDMQGYSAMGSTFLLTPVQPFELKEERMTLMKELIDAGLAYRTPHRGIGISPPPFKGKPLDWQTILNTKKQEAITMDIDMSPFKVETFAEHTGATALRTRLLELGFKLSPAENRVWNKWIAHYKD